MDEKDMKELIVLIEEIERSARGLIERSQGIQAIERNADRILASTKMLKLNVTDVLVQ